MSAWHDDKTLRIAMGGKWVTNGLLLDDVFRSAWFEFPLHVSYSPDLNLHILNIRSRSAGSGGYFNRYDVGFDARGAA